MPLRQDAGNVYVPTTDPTPPEMNRGRAADALRYSLLANRQGALDVEDSPLLQQAISSGVILPGSVRIPQAQGGGTIPQPPQGGGERGGGGGGGGGGGSSAPQPPAIGDVLKNIVFPGQDQLPPFLRDFGRFIEDLLVNQQALAIAPPQIADGSIVTEGSQVQTLEVPQDVEAYASMWNTFLGMVQTANQSLQQQLLGLSYNPGTGFYMSGQAPLLPNLSEL